MKGSELEKEMGEAEEIRVLSTDRVIAIDELLFAEVEEVSGGYEIGAFDCSTCAECPA